MDAARLTDERLRYGLDGNPPSRERLCMAILGLDRSYSHIVPRRPNGGPDGSRDIECRWMGQPCFGAVGFRNSVSDSPEDKRTIRNKFKNDVTEARNANPEVKCFVFFCNVDLTPAETTKFKEIGTSLGFTHVDIYWRERLRQALDSPEGLASRYQFLDIEMSREEQSAFFSRFGSELSDLVRGRFDRMEQKIDELAFENWKSGFVSKLNLSVNFHTYEPSVFAEPFHFRVCLELQSVVTEKRGILIGAQDHFWQTSRKDGWYFGRKAFFWRQRFGEISDSWILQDVRMGCGVVSHIDVGLRWSPRSNILPLEFDGLFSRLHFSESLSERIAHVTFSLDDYVLLDHDVDKQSFESFRPSLGWPSELTPEQAAIPWRSVELPKIGGVWGMRPFRKTTD